jgi:ATP-binding cassette subfamily F protein 3
MEYFAQDEAVRLDPTLTVYDTLQAGSPHHMVPAIRTILGGFLFSGDDVHKKVAVLSGGERTRLAVARMLLRPSNTLLLDEPTNHLDLDSKDVLLEALEDYGGTLIFVSHDRYFVEKLATKIIEIGHGGAVVYPGRYAEFLWSKAQQEAGAVPGSAGAPGPKAPSNSGKSTGRPSAGPSSQKGAAAAAAPASKSPETPDSRESRKKIEAERRRKQRAHESLQRRIVELEGRIAAGEEEIRQLETEMSSPGFYERQESSKPVIDRHQALMWEVGDLMAQWEALQEHATTQAPES